MPVVRGEIEDASKHVDERGYAFRGTGDDSRKSRKPSLMGAGMMFARFFRGDSLGRSWDEYDDPPSLPRCFVMNGTRCDGMERGNNRGFETMRFAECEG